MAPAAARVFIDDINSALFMTITEEESNDIHKVVIKDTSENYTTSLLYSFFDGKQNPTLFFNTSFWKIVHPEITLPPPEVVV
ncbi:hypothetical protein ULMS_05030 [Patiriisocius marinistellae]|uniref:Uncharacterized protein n=1 Tax=Patiriisocius marinistellae TaxID=2494560 RepID=A0A5J4FY66_9FLAO|nr:hypothetical protein ULMS_05030 [Patiriisocius marinistellae]